jgi:hypothetical protein
MLSYPKHIYPIINCERSENTLLLNTTLRKKHRGKYYLWEFERRAFVPDGNNDYTAAISSFNRDIYLCQMFGNIDTKLIYKDGTKIFQLDINQQSEEERLKPRQV